MKVECKLMTFDSPNLNGRIFSKEMMIEQLDKYIKNNDGLCLGCLSRGDGEFRPDIDLEHISHKIIDYHIDENSAILDAEILDTVDGKFVKDMGIDKFGMELVGYAEKIDENNVLGFNLCHIDLIEKGRCAWKESCIKEIKD